MADPNLWQSVISGLLSGGGGAAASIVAVFRDLKNRLTAIETRLGRDGTEPGTPKTGIYLVLDHLTNSLGTLDDGFRKWKREMDAWPEDPPEWLIRLVNRAAQRSSVNLEHHGELERIIEQRFRTNASNIARLEEKLDALEKAVSDCIDRAEYERDGRERAEELGKIREGLATANGLLRGVMSALGYLEPPTKKRLPGAP